MHHSIDKAVLLKNLQTDEMGGLASLEASARIVKKRKPIPQVKR